MTDLNKRQKKEIQAFYSAQRVTNGFNTGTRTMQTDKKPTRAKQKRLDRKVIADSYR